MRPKIIDTVSGMQRWADEQRGKGGRIGLVPTMGYLHEGHLGLVDIAGRRCDVVVVSIFVNPTQFGPKEDFNKYPRDLERDLDLLSTRKADIVFHPAAHEMYPEGFSTYTNVEGLNEGLCGASRPTHFRGVATVCLKLFNAVKPHVAVFGRKDYQQWRVIERMVRDINLDLEIIGAPIVREPDGLAMSSRNVYLSAEEREAALCIKRGLDRAKAAFENGERGCSALLDLAREIIASEPLARIDYLEIVDVEKLKPVQGKLDRDACMAAAAFFGKTRLIDNTELSVTDRGTNR